MSKVFDGREVETVGGVTGDLLDVPCDCVEQRQQHLGRNNTAHGSRELSRVFSLLATSFVLLFVRLQLPAAIALLLRSAAAVGGRPSLSLTVSMNLLATSMKCIVYGDGIASVQRQIPSSATKGHVLVRVHAVGLNPVDAKNVVGDKLPFESQWVKRYLRDKIIGFDFSGTVVEGAGFVAGDRIFGTMPPFHGSLAEYVLAPAHQVARMPQVSFEEAAALPLVGLTALQCLSPHVSESTRILVVGASGGTGHVALQVAKQLGASKIVAVASQEEHCSGATHFVNYRSDGFLERLATEGPYDVVLDCVTSGDPRDQTMDYPRLLQSYEPSLLTKDYVYRRLGGKTPDWIRAGLERTAGVGCWRDRHEKLFWIRFPHSSRELQTLTEWVNDGKLKIKLEKVYDFSPEGVRDAFSALLSRRVRGKVVINVRSDDS